MRSAGQESSNAARKRAGFGGHCRAGLPLAFEEIPEIQDSILVKQWTGYARDFKVMFQNNYVFEPEGRFFISDKERSGLTPQE